MYRHSLSFLENEGDSKAWNARLRGIKPVIRKAGNARMKCVCVVHGCHGARPDRQSLSTIQEGVPHLPGYPGIKGLQGGKREGGILVSCLIMKKPDHSTVFSALYQRP